MSYKAAPLEHRFWRHVDKTRGFGPDGDCWEWSAARYSPGGYGAIGMGSGRVRLAHRVSWELHNGLIPAGLFVCHKCDNKGCVRPDHLFLGTPTDNVLDMIAKGRKVVADTSGEKNPRAVVSREAVLEIRCRYVGRSKTDGARALAREFGVRPQQIGRIVRGEAWQSVQEAN